MGAYINPDSMSKEAWLDLYAVPMSRGACESFEDFNGKHLPVVLVDNGPFTAAAIGFNAGEIEAFTSLDDMRPKSFWLAPVDLLHEVSRELKMYQDASAKGEATR